MSDQSKSLKNVESGNEEEDYDAQGRERFGSRWAYLMTAIGYSVGLGNIWRFPAVAYKNGGGAFLIPYFTCTVLFGMPIFYLESFVGQYTQSSVHRIFHKYMPVMQGLGWAMTFLTQQVNVYYLVVVGWSVIYLWDLFTGRSRYWTECGHEWNTPDCLPSVRGYGNCTAPAHGEPFVTQNNVCFYGLDALNASRRLRVPTEEYFEEYILLRSTDISEGLFEMNWKLFVAMVFIWSLCGLMLWKGVNVMGKIAYVTALLPYVIVGIFFFHGLFLPGMGKGLSKFIVPNLDKVFELRTWKEAVHHTCISLTIGTGGVHSMGSYNPKRHNSFRDSWVVVSADAFMSIVGGVAVFTTLGYLSELTGKEIEDLSTSHFGLTFVTYPEAMSQMTFPWLWAFLFFFMMLLLGVSTVMVDMQAIIAALIDSCDFLKEREWLARVSVILALLAGSTVSCTKAGCYFVTLMDECCGGVAMGLLILLELILVCHIYDRWGRHREDLQNIFGRPKGILGSWLGKSGLLYWLSWKFLTPIFCLVIMYNAGQFPEVTYGGRKPRLDYPNDAENPYNPHKYEYPPEANLFGYIWGNLSLVFVLCFGAYNVYRAAQDGNWRDAFTLHPSHPSYARLYGSADEATEKERASLASNSSSAASPEGTESQSESQLKSTEDR
ncbi:unnamed protein product, partial [Mesorhabditis spiculigera]